MAEEVVGSLGGVDLADFDLVGGDAGGGELGNVGGPEVEIGVAVGAIGVGKEAVGVGEFDGGHVQHFGTNFVAGRPDAGADTGQHVGGFCVIGGLHRPKRGRDHAVDRAAPAGMTDTQYMVLLIIEQNGYAIGKEEQERQTDGIGDQAIALLFPLVGVAPIDLGDAGAMHLTTAHQIGRFNPNGRSESVAILFNA